jgi:lipase maturation factor 1
LISWFFVRGLVLIYFAAFLSMTEQIERLIGANGFLPMASLLELIGQNHQASRFLILPTVFWFDASDPILAATCLAGTIAACILLLGVYQRLILLLCFIRFAAGAGSLGN